jgi:hypothetical protein
VKTASSVGLDVLHTRLAIADEMIELGALRGGT